MASELPFLLKKGDYARYGNHKGILGYCQTFADYSEEY